MLNTYDSVLEESRQMFNTLGVAASSINRISDRLGISTGNLTYYFKRKKDIVAKHLEKCENELVEAIAGFPVMGRPVDIFLGWKSMLEITKKYKFLFISAPYLLQSKLISTDQFDRLIEHIHSELKNKTQFLIKKGLVTAMEEPFNVDYLVDCIWWQWQGWLNESKLNDTYNKLSADEHLAAGVKHIIFLVYPYVRKKPFKNELSKLIH